MYNDNNEYNFEMDKLRFSNEQKAHLTQNLLDADTAPRHFRRPLPRIAAVGIAAALVLSIGAGATVVYSQLASESFAGVFGTAHTEIIDKIGRPIGAAVSDNGVTVTADAIIGDKYHYAITYSVSKDDGTPFDVDFEAIEGTNLLPMGFVKGDTNVGHLGGAHGSSYFYDADPTDNAIQYVEMMETDKELRPGTVKAKFEDLQTYGENGETTTLAEGTWKLKFQMDFEDTSIALPAGQTFAQDGMDFTIDEITLSPIALRVDYTVDSEVEWSNAPSGRESEWDSEQMVLYLENVALSVQLTDGTVVEMKNAGGMVEPKNGKTYCQKGDMFDAVIPLADIASVTVGGVTIPLA